MMGWLVSAVSPVVSYRLWFVSRRVYDGVASVSSQFRGYLYRLVCATEGSMMRWQVAEISSVDSYHLVY